MKIALFTLASLFFLFAISLYLSLRTVTSPDQIGVKNGSKGLAFGLGVLILLCLVLFVSVAQGYTGRCYQLLGYDDLGTPCSRVEHFSSNAGFAIAINLMIGWPFILIFLGICVLVAYLSPKLTEKRGN
jgi:hypothetical protein